MDSTHCILYYFGLRKPVTQTSIAEREALRRHAAGRRSIVEIGVYQGVNTRLFVECASPSGVVYAVDPFFTGRLGISFNRRVARSHVGSSRGAAVKWIRDISPSAAGVHHIPADITFDFIFIDGDHSYDAVELDWKTWIPRLEPGGLVALHDSRGGLGAGSEKFTNEVILRDAAFKLVETVDTLTVVSRSNSDVG